MLQVLGKGSFGKAYLVKNTEANVSRPWVSAFWILGFNVQGFGGLGLMMVQGLGVGFLFFKCIAAIWYTHVKHNGLGPPVPKLGSWEA